MKLRSYTWPIEFFLKVLCFATLITSCKTRTRNENAKTKSAQSAESSLLAYESWPRYSDFISEYGNSISETEISTLPFDYKQKAEILTLIVALEKIYPNHSLVCVGSEVSKMCNILDIFYTEYTNRQKVTYLKSNSILFNKLSAATRSIYAKKLLEDLKLNPSLDENEGKAKLPIVFIETTVWDNNSISKLLTQTLCAELKAARTAEVPCSDKFGHISVFSEAQKPNHPNVVALPYSGKMQAFIDNYKTRQVNTSLAPENIIGLHLPNLLNSQPQLWHEDFDFLTTKNSPEFKLGQRRDLQERTALVKETFDIRTYLYLEEFHKKLKVYGDGWQVPSVVKLAIEGPKRSSVQSDVKKEKLLQDKDWPRYSRYLDVFGELPKKPYKAMVIDEDLKKEIYDIILSVEKVFPNAINACVGRDAVLICDVLDIFYTEYAKQKRVVYLGLSTPSISSYHSTEQIPILKKFLTSSGFNPKQHLDKNSQPFVFLDSTSWSESSQVKLLTEAAYQLAIEEGSKASELITTINAISIGKPQNEMMAKTYPISQNFNSKQFFENVKAALIGTLRRYDYPTQIAKSYLPKLVYGENTWNNVFSQFITDKNGKTYAPVGNPSDITQRSAVIDKMILLANFIKSQEFKSQLAEKAKIWNLPSIGSLVQ